MKYIFLFFFLSFLLGIEYNEDSAYEIVVPRKGPMGFEVGVENNYIIVSHVIPGGVAAKTGMVDVGDRLVSLNDYPLEGLTLQDFQAVLVKSSFPRRLLFVPKDDWDRDDEGLVKQRIAEDAGIAEFTHFKPTKLFIHILEPEILKQGYKIVLTPLGAIKYDTEKTFSIVGFENDGCAPYSDSLEGKVVVVWRGTCSLPDKADNADKAGAIGIIVVNNILGEVPDLRKVDASTSTVKIPIFYIDRILGNTLVKVGLDLPNNTAQFSTTDLKLRPEIQRLPIKNIHNNNNDFFPQASLNLTFFSSTFTLSTEAKISLYGPPPMKFIYPIVYVGTGCNGFTNDGRGMVVLFDHGSCPFEDKTRITEKIKGMATILIDDQDHAVQVPATNLKNINIGTVQIAKSAGVAIKEALAKNSIMFCNFYS